MYTYKLRIAVKISDIDLLAPLTGLSGLFSSLNLGTGSFELLRCFCDCTDRDITTVNASIPIYLHAAPPTGHSQQMESGRCPVDVLHVL